MICPGALHFSRWAAVASALALAACATAPPAAVGLPVNQAFSASIAPASTSGIKAKSSAVATPPMDASIDLSAAPSSADLQPLEAAPPERYAIRSEWEVERGGASWYGPRFHGRLTANGERYDMGAMTAAHKTLPFGTMVRVKSLVNGREVLVRITDRGPFIRNRIIDLSRAAAAELDMLNLGFKQVVLMVAEGEAVRKEPTAVKRRRSR